ncbi:MAG: gliding motility-associated C-terminal domain-containing protein [Bacteroidia bacterium]|nr:gliding motility-associated C-terminal domain-containing protein [Bacteroidia bacterium]
MKAKRSILNFTCGVVVLVSTLYAQPGCPNITASASSPSVGCGSSPCVTLTASAFNIGQTTTYSVASIPFAPPYPISGSGIGVSVGTDDVWSPIINLPFPFCFFGSSYTQCLIGSNGVITFNTSSSGGGYSPGGYCPWPFSASCPSAALITNAIFGVYHDIDPSVCGSVTYTLIGTAPCRMLVVNFNNVCHFSCNSLKSSFQIVLYETTNVIEVYVQNKPTCSSWNSGNALIGIQNAAGTVGYTPPGRNTGPWTASNEAWRFVPAGPSIYGPIQWYDASGLFATGNSVVVCPSSTTTYTAVTTYTRCDGLNITVSSPVTITAFNSMTTNVVTTNASCASGTLSSGSATANVVGGTAPITYSWIPSGGSGSVATGLSPGTYTCIISDASNCSAVHVFTISSPNVPSFSISLTDDTLTCTQPTISATAVNTNTNISSMNYTFTSISSGTSTSNPLTVSTPGTYTVFGMDPSTGCIATNTFAVGIYTTIPSVTVSPNSLNIPCTGSAGTFTGSSTPTTNITYQWLQPGGSPVNGNLLTPGVAGTYTFVATNIANGCYNTFTVAVTQSTNAPTMTVTATNNNYNIKCSPNTVTLVVNATQASGGGVPIPYWTNASGSSTLSTSNTFTTNTPGNYVCVVYDPAPGGCTISQTITVGIDTIKPTGGYTLNIPTNTLSCKYPTAIITGTSPVNGATFIWYTPGTVPDQTLSINSTTNISQTTIGTYTLEITDPNNGCKRKIPVTLYQDKQPLSLTAKATPTTLTCKDLQTTLQFTPNPVSEPLTFTWTTPPPTFTNNINNPITFYSSGTYTLCTTRTSNGCQTCTTVLVGSNTTPPPITSVPPSTIVCGYSTTTIEAGTTPSTNITYLWSGPKDATLSTLTGYSTNVNMPGTYYVTITNTTTGCFSTNSVVVVNGTINASFNPQPDYGFAPLSVTFNNTSDIGTSAIWIYGNGITQTFTNTLTTPAPNGSTTYGSAGIYTVTLIAQKGTCVSTHTAIVRVENPSDIEVPNVFTPNGDGVNDYFILHTTNLTEINCTIMDRWGVKMYEVTTDKGNIQWDGKTMGGKDAPTGTYFYIIKAKGLDGKEYENKGFISLIR